MKVLSLISLLLSSSLIYAQSSSYQHQNTSAASAFDDLDAEFGEAPKRAPVKKEKVVPVKNVTIIQQKIIHVHQAAPTPEPIEVAVATPVIQKVPDIEIPSHSNAIICQKYKDQHPNATSGKYIFTLDNKEQEIFCEMELDGGGWSAIWTAKNDKYNTKDFIYDIPLSNIKNMKEVMIGYTINGSLISAYKFNKPKPWNFAHPLNSQSKDTYVNVVNLIEGTTYKHKLLRYGYASFDKYCGSQWNNIFSLGRLCIADTDAPFYSNFSYSHTDTCNYSNAINRAKCGQKRFIILGR